MPYKLAEYHGDTLAVPQLVVSHLTQTDGDTIRAALYLLQTGLTIAPGIVRRLLALETKHLLHVVAPLTEYHYKGGQAAGMFFVVA